ncbi:MAG: aminoacyl-tRNA hydrolase [Bacteroidia bacterium]|nr:aminoacyl-tRNA hydrolase [Bacteroidia bacterium]
MKYLIVGLGNIGSEYESTRHNIGFMVADALAAKLSASFSTDRYADKVEGKFKGKPVIMIKPSTYMNLSGKAVRFHLEKQNIDIKHLIVITDDIALPFGKCRLKPSGSDGGHNGLKSIQDLLSTTQYPRLRVGVGSDFPKGGQADYVLSPFTEEEQKDLPAIIEKCVNGIIAVISEGLDRTMNQFNK